MLGRETDGGGKRRETENNIRWTHENRRGIEVDNTETVIDLN